MKGTPIPPNASPALERPMRIRVLNWVGRTLEQWRLQPVPLGPASLIAAAQRKTGMTEWGDDAFLLPLRQLTTALEEEASLNLVGRLAMRTMLTELICNRLRIYNEINDHPQIVDKPIRRPLIIVSLPRTGTTLLHRLLAQDPHNRTLRLWETGQPAPAPYPADSPSAAQSRNAQRFISHLGVLAPEFAPIHSLSATAPEECIGLLQTSFCTQCFSLHARLPSYLHQLERQPMRRTYAELYQQLQILQYRIPTERWVLKSPFHLYGLDALLQIFPDANIVQIHREPLEVLPSMCSLTTTLRRVNSDWVDPHQTGQEVLTQWGKAQDLAMAARASADPRRFFDIDYRHLVADPLAAVQALYAHFDYAFDASTAASMGRWMTQNPQHKHGVHRYSLEQFGLDPVQINHRFATYRAQFLHPTSS